MKIPELSTCEFKISAFPNSVEYRGFCPAVKDENGKVVAVFFGIHGQALAAFLTTWTDAMKLAEAQIKYEDSNKEVPIVSTSDGRGTEVNV